ncbi:type 1 glutamine amidotransferase domain-containing protein [Flagellimonas flava]|uniref:Putative intracellular protease/amidase n=1 Tax=Flagellimonas flava TaxID=570519 RepID=A0A1M5N9C4_9FLAO|nr:type 1 glutamine amidotransferase domain-containing protein [Allomuricauda flava]SHG86111.1 Putative intracellular protease/amidase [Allomuricauda flava]
MRQLVSIVLVLFTCSCHQKQTYNQKEGNVTQTTIASNHIGKILFITSNQHTYGDTDINAANHFAELVLAYDEFERAGYDVDFVSPEGGPIPIGYLNTSDSIEKKYLYDFNFMELLKTTMKPSDVVPEDYQAVYYGGGGAAMFGVPENKLIQRISMEIYEKNKGVISAICHGSAGLVNLKTSEGEYIYKNKKVNGFPDLFENMEATYYKQFPFSIQQLLTERGGDFQYSKEGWDNFSIADDRLITGQDPTAAASVAQLVINKLKSIQNP